jgi:hypothetical protein
MVGRRFEDVFCVFIRSRTVIHPLVLDKPLPFQLLMCLMCSVVMSGPVQFSSQQVVVITSPWPRVCPPVDGGYHTFSDAILLPGSFTSYSM